MWILLLQIWVASFAFIYCNGEVLERRLFRATGITKAEYKEISLLILPQQKGWFWLGKWTFVFLLSPFEALVQVVGMVFYKKSLVQFHAGLVAELLPADHRHHAALFNVGHGRPVDTKIDLADVLTDYLSKKP